jgi:ubiquinone/menaquinone biosynthesis C-methylase UbiE
MFAFVFAFNSYALAQGNNAENGAQQNQQQEQTFNQGEDSQIQVQIQEQAQEQIDIEDHRSAVANFVMGLENIADRETGIGQQVRTIAQQQNQSASTTMQIMEKVQTRSKVKTFFFGNDYKNLGALRSEIVQTRNRLDHLNQLMENVQSEEEQTELQNQIQTLEQEQVKIENFIEAEEDKFSLFGWLVKMFQ